MKLIKDNGDLFTGIIVVDGYDVGDRLLEHVMFEADVKDGVVDVDSTRVRSDCADYFSSLNEKKWLDAMKESIANEDEHFETTDGQEVWFATTGCFGSPPVATKN